MTGRPRKPNAEGIIMGQKSRKKVCILLVVGIVISVAAMFWATLTILTFFAYKAETRQTEYKYASRYDLPIGGDGYTEGRKWHVYKKDEHGVIYLYVYHAGAKTTETDYMQYMIFNSAKDAGKIFENRYKQYNEEILNEGENWFRYNVPGVCDAYIESMYYLEGNVIICADVSVTSTWASYYDEDYDTSPSTTETFDTTDPAGGHYDLNNLAPYIFANAPSIREFILEEVCGS